MRNQVKFTFQIGYAAPNEAFERGIIEAVSTVCGGCTTSHKAGWWREDGATHADRFDGALQREHCFELELTCEEHKADHAYQDARLAIVFSALRHGVDTDWVHVTETKMTGRHFSVKAAIPPAAVAAE